MSNSSHSTLPEVFVVARTVVRDMTWYKLELKSGSLNTTCTTCAQELEDDKNPVIMAARRHLGYAILGQDRDQLAKRVGVAINDARDKALPTFSFACGVGWTEDLQSYVTPQKIYGAPIEVSATAFSGVPSHANYARSEGHQEDWQRVFAPVLRQNPLFVFASTVALMPPMLALAGMPGCMFSFVGESSTGKTSLIDFMGSVRGGIPEPDLGFQDSFRATANFLERYATASHDGLLLLDDIRSIPPRERARVVEEAIYFIAGGRTKGRANDASIRPASFRTVAVTSDNFPLRRLLGNAGIEHDPSMLVRFIEIAIPSPAGVLQEEGLSRAARAERIAGVRQSSHKHFGHVGHRFLKRLVKSWNTDRDELQSSLYRRIQRQQDRLLSSDADNIETRVSKYFALAYATGKLAINYGALPISTAQLRDAVGLAYELHRSAVESSQHSDPIALVRSAIRERYASLVLLDSSDISDNTLRSAAGYRKQTSTGEQLLFTKSQFDSLVPSGMGSKRLCDALRRRDLLYPDTGGSPASRKNAKKVWIGESRPRAYCISSRILGG